jgi:hypothetical protein
MKNPISRIYNGRVKQTIKPFLFLILSTLIILSFFEVNSLNTELSAQKGINEELANDLFALNSSHALLIENYGSLLENYSSFSEKFSELERNYSSFENDIQSQLSYFQSNSNIENVSEFAGIKSQLANCFYIYSLNTYKINLPCINFVLTHESEGNNFIYKNDTRNELLSLSEFYYNKGGDCDDWGRIFFASFNYIKSVIKSESIEEPKILLETYMGECEIKEIFWMTRRNDWYIDACPITLNDYDSAQVLCGAKPDDEFGHCWVAFSKNKINSTETINDMIQDSVLIEPQSGEHIFSYSQAAANNYNFYVLITENDLAMKSNIYDNASWKGYIDYYNELESKKESILNIMALFN